MKNYKQIFTKLNSLNNIYTKTNYKVAFTLSEVLVTITVIGAIAAMTLPNLNTHFKKQQYSARLKNFINNMDNALNQYEKEKGSLKDLKRPSNYFNWYMETLDPYIGHQYVNKNNKTIYYKDGSSFYLGYGRDVDFDVNGKRKPNTYGIDKFRFIITVGNDADMVNARNAWCSQSHLYFCSDGYHATSKKATRTTNLNSCKKHAWGCTRLLELDGWEFKDDYPYKIK